MSKQTKPLNLQNCKTVSFYTMESLWLSIQKELIEGGGMRMTIKLITTGPHHSRSVKQRPAFITQFPTHAAEKTSRLSQERSWGLKVLLFRVEKAGSPLPCQRCCSQFPKIRRRHSTPMCWGYPALSGQTSCLASCVA